MRVDGPCRTGGRFAQLDSKVADLGDRVGEQAGDLGFKSAGAHNLAERRICSQWKQIAGHIKGARFESPLVGLGLEGLRARDPVAQQLENCRRGALVGGK